METGVLWRIRRRPGEHRGEVPRKPIVLPVNLFRMMIPLAGIVIGFGVLVWLLTKWIRHRLRCSSDVQTIREGRRLCSSASAAIS